MTTEEALDTNENEAQVSKIEVAAYEVPTEVPEQDGTLNWTSTTMVLVEVSAGSKTGLGYTYANRATAVLIRDTLVQIVLGSNAFDVVGNWHAMIRSIRNMGREGIASMAISAVDNALWDLKARLMEISTLQLLGAVRAEVPVYGSGGFTSYPIEMLQKQLSSWVGDGISMVKMKVGAHPEGDFERVHAAREAIGAKASLFVDANGAYGRKQALDFAEVFSRDYGVSWFEEPVPSDDLEGLRLIRNRAPVDMEISAGEYGYHPGYFRRMIDADAVDVLQADTTRCEGVTGFLRAGAICEARHVPMSTHCAPSLHAHLACAVSPVRHVEYFHDHVRIEHMLFDGALHPVNGCLAPDLTWPGFGLDFKRIDAEQYLI